MTEVALLVTGVTELELGAALAPVFPSLRFTVLPRLDGFTSNRVGDEDPVEDGRARELARALIAAVDPGRARRGEAPPDYAVAIDDLELANRDRPAVVVEHFRRAVDAEIAAMWPSAARQDRCRAIVRERCSFHLFTPMIEAYFYGDRAALLRARARRASAFDGLACDPEAFSVAEPDFLAPASGAVYWATEGRGEHPKRYLEFLIDPQGDAPKRERYREARDGRAGLRGLAWREITAPPAHVAFLRSLLADLADIAGVDAPSPGVPAGPTGLLHHRARTLRNVVPRRSDAAPPASAPPGDLARD